MSIFTTILKRILLIFSGVFVLYFTQAQTPTYSVDSDFNTGELFRDGAPVFDIFILDDGRYLVGGGFSNFGVSPVAGFGMIYSNGDWDDNFLSPEITPLKIITQNDGYVYPYITGYSKITLDGDFWGSVNGDFWSEYNAGGTNSPYNVERAWDIYQLENSDLIIAGAITTDTLQPGLFRGLARIHSDGTIDSTFPAVNITPNNGSGAVRKIFPAPDGSWYISGSFTAINGHETNHVAKLNSDFEVDSTFVSPFMYDGPVNYTEDIILVDDQSRVWVSGYNMRLQENPNDTIQLCRLMYNGSIDTDFPLVKLTNEYPDEWMTWKPNIAAKADELEAHPGNYIVYGSFNHYNDTLQPCIAVVNDDGIIQANFFQGQGATLHTPYEDDDFIYPAVYTIKQLTNGDLLVGGAFTQFMGETHYSVVKLKPGFVGVEDSQLSGGVKVYPNPGDSYVEFEYEIFKSSDDNTLRITDIQGRPIEFWELGSDQMGIKVLNTQRLSNGIYFYELLQNGIKLKDGKFIIQH